VSIAFRDAMLEVSDDDDQLVAESAIILSIVPPGEAYGCRRAFSQPADARRSETRPSWTCNAVSRRRCDASPIRFAQTGCDSSTPASSAARRVQEAKAPGPRFYASASMRMKLNRPSRLRVDVE